MRTTRSAGTRNPSQDLHEIGEDVRLILGLVVLDVRRAEVGVAAVGAVEAILPLNDHAEVLVVEHEHLHREVLGVQGGELLDVHHEGAVAVDVNHRLARARGGAPMAAGRPKPMEPRPPEVSQLRGSSNL